jgi:hypothetical protein
MQVSTSVKSIESSEFFNVLQERYGYRLEEMGDQWKKLFRAALANFQASQFFWDEEGNSITAADCAVVCAGGDDMNVWEDDPELVEYIQQACQLSDSEREFLICAISAHIRG